jgi:hypothetical protein
MTCKPILDAKGNQIGFACSRRTHVAPCVECGRPSTKQCDFELKNAKRRTCDRALCDRCARSVGKNRDYCRIHYEMSR